jgi:hypothetical protein
MRRKYKRQRMLSHGFFSLRHLHNALIRNRLDLIIAIMPSIVFFDSGPDQLHSLSITWAVAHFDRESLQHWVKFSDRVCLSASNGAITSQTPANVAQK